jgi:hypothetical protein
MGHNRELSKRQQHHTYLASLSSQSFFESTMKEALHSLGASFRVMKPLMKCL